jgi:hypothetical protein
LSELFREKNKIFSNALFRSKPMNAHNQTAKAEANHSGALPCNGQLTTGGQKGAEFRTKAVPAFQPGTWNLERSSHPHTPKTRPLTRVNSG